ncbi:hypothetical protein [Chryseobacterium vrystaatense]|uniref:Uncharacterized protein n=1 Tax=Chryseobacterium vrystaatense TaxID=307480 RepID=A0ABR4US07_9FLAO|nr:hypothetical protein [Chryseobacterium vrystaatense]KFF28053.1 hypothetical protein IW16_02210 [Chryseobacterium vrystaatense]
MNRKKYFQNYDDFDEESQSMLLAFQNKVLKEIPQQNNSLAKATQTADKVSNISESLSEVTDWITDEYVDLNAFIVKIKAANRAMNDYQFSYNPQELESNIEQKSIQNKNNEFIQLKVYRNPKIGNVSVKWKDSRITQKIDPRNKKIYYRLHFYYVNSQETAFVLETCWYQDFRDLNILLNYGDVDKYEADYNYFLQNFANALRNEKSAERLKFIYENIPESILSGISHFVDHELFFEHLDILSKDDDSDIFKDSSTAVIQIFKAFGNPVPILNYFRENPSKLNRIYYNLDKSSEHNGKLLSNRMILANFMLVFSMFSKNVKQKKTAQTFTIGKGFKINSNILEVGIFQRDNDNYRDTFFLQQQKEELQNVKVIPKEGNPNEHETVITDLDDGAQYHPLDMVYLIDISGEKEASYFVPAIYIKALADEREWEVVLQNIRIAADIVAVILGLLTLPTGNPYFLLLAIADISLAGADLTIQVFKEEILKYEGGKEFLEAWEKIYIIGGALTVGALVVSSFYKIGLKLLTIPEVIKNVKLKQTIVAHIISVLLDVNLINFERNSVKILTQNTEIVSATSGSFNEYRMMKLQEQGVMLLSGDVNKGNKIVIEYNLIYNGNIVAKGEKASFYKQIKEVGKNYYKDDKLVEVLEEMEDDVWKYFDKEHASGGKYPIRELEKKYTIGEGLEFEKGVKYLNEKERDAYEIFIQHNKIVDFEGKLFDTHGSIFRPKVGDPTKTNMAIFVMSENGKIYVSKNYGYGEFHHSSFLSGKPISAGGEIYIERGIIKEITNDSGHYTPPFEFVEKNMVNELDKRYYFISGNKKEDIKFKTNF